MIEKYEFKFALMIEKYEFKFSHFKYVRGSYAVSEYWIQEP